MTPKEFEDYRKTLNKIADWLEQEPCEDCISRQAVIDINHNHYGEMPNHINHQIWEEINALPSIQPTTKENLVVGDCISRQAVDTLVDELARAISDERCCISRGRDTATIMQEILDLPSIQPETGHWIEEPNCWTRCSCCGEHYPQTSIYGFIGSNYCPNCGVKMESEVKE